MHKRTAANLASFQVKGMQGRVISFTRPHVVIAAEFRLGAWARAVASVPKQRLDTSTYPYIHQAEWDPNASL